jgi:hypothetical protein
MATILAFTPGHRHPASAENSGRGMQAEIVIFPGVRYERMAQAPLDKPLKRRRARRDKIELQDR